MTITQNGKTVGELDEATLVLRNATPEFTDYFDRLQTEGFTRVGPATPVPGAYSSDRLERFHVTVAGISDLIIHFFENGYRVTNIKS